MDAAGNVPRNAPPAAHDVRRDPTTRLKSREELFKIVGTCRCWGDRETTPRTIELDSVYTGIKSDIRVAVQDLNEIIDDLQRHASGTEDRAGPAKIRVHVDKLLVSLLMGFESAALAIILTPGYVCRSGCAEHEARFRERKKTLSDIAETITQGMQEASAAYGSQAILARTAARIRQRELALVAVRTASLVLIPFAPAVAAAFSALDVLAFSAHRVTEELFVPGAAAQIREAVARIETLERGLTAQLAQVRALQDELAAIRQRVEAEQRQPASGRLVDVLEAVRRAMRAAKTLQARAAGSGEGVGEKEEEESLAMLVEAVRRVGEAMEDESLVVGAAATMSVEECAALDRSWDNLRTCV